ncbi:putative separase, putative,cysteine peptidase, Clan CD, family C50 [Trypanosoma theileri]|uniref:separase n=1 Tax=Trypanosoma theileri TaxID=67003 RepID=A0A1X0NW57_9TRYP|nr:putative separase, putative,cysteine peptidase, Clan CD, family C50 [Trypanosoma theileri]ORC88912.1 putative separase, putative,cysteine peptidase, Clan CD, family C50 [Trypanosoma theileri]
MKPAASGGILLRLAESPLANEAELQDVLAAAKSAAVKTSAVHDKWRTVKLLAAAARCTLQAGRGTFALPLITTAFELSPPPFSQLTRLQYEVTETDRCEMAHLISSIAANTQEDDKEVTAIVCTSIMVWHTALATVDTSGSHPQTFLRFSHAVTHILTSLVVDEPALENWSTCWMYNVLAFAHCHKKREAVGFYLLREIHDEKRLSDLVPVDEWGFSCSTGVNICVRLGLRGSHVATMWKRFCASLYAEGSLVLREAQEEVCRHSSDAMSILQQAFQKETTHLQVDFRRPLALSINDVIALRDTVLDAKVCLTRKKFDLVRLASFLVIFESGESYLSSVDYPMASVSSVVALAQRQRYTDIAVEILQLGLRTNSNGNSFVVSGKELKLLFEHTISGDSGIQCSPHHIQSLYISAQEQQQQQQQQQHPNEPEMLLHEAIQNWSAFDMLRTLLFSETLEGLLPAAITLIRGDTKLAHQLLSDKVAPSFVLEGLSRTVISLVEEGDVPLARCFLPLLVGICVRMPSQAHLLLTLQAITSFVQSCSDDDDDDDGEWKALTAILLPLMPPRCAGATLTYQETKTTVIGRTFSKRCQVFDTLRSAVSASSSTYDYSQLQIILTADQKGVRLVRTSSINGITPWEKVLPVKEVLLEMVNRMRDIELRNRRHLDSFNSEEEFTTLEKIHNDDSIGEKPNDKRRVEWWEQRHALDRALGDVVKEMQSENIFGCWRLAMCGDLTYSCMMELQSMASELLQRCEAPLKHVEDVVMILMGLPFLKICHVFKDRLPFNPSHVNMESSCDLCNEIFLDIAQGLETELLNQGIIASLGDDDVTMVREMCLRTLRAIWNASFGEEKQNVEHLDLLQLTRSPVYLVLDNELHCLPFEAIDVFRCGNVSRVPTATFISLRSNGRSRSLGDGLTYCAIDPNGVMPKTSKRLLPVCQRNGWTVNSNGITSGKLRELYASQAKLYVYVGHGKGERFLNRQELYERFPDPINFPAVFLMGCSSAYMDSGPSFDCFGMPYAFLHAGCPLFMGCLWHVTDGEIDRLTKRLLMLISGDSCGDSCVRRPQTIGEALALVRQACKLPFLTGYATVLYGINLPLQSAIEE